MLLYYPFWMFMGFTLHFYTIFGTNLLTGGQARIVIFLLVSVFRRKGISKESKRNENFGAWFLGRTWSRGLGVEVKQQPRRPWGWRVPPTKRAPYLVGPLGVHRPTSSYYIYPRTPKTSREPTKNNFHRHNLLYPWDPILEPSPALRRRGNRPWRASTSTP